MTAPSLSSTSTSRRFALDLRHLPLLIAIVVVSLPTFMVPGTDLDSSWAVGLSWGRVLGLSFGDQLVFTYGPWVFLDQIPMFSWPMMVAGTFVHALSGWAVVLLAYRLLRCRLDQLPAGLVVALVVASCLLVDSHSSGRILMVAVLVSIGMAMNLIRPRLLVVGIVAAVSALAIEIKFSNGVLALASIVLAGLLVSGTTRARVARLAVAGGATLIAIPLLWVVGGQALSHLVPWFRGSLELTGGYAEAMATESPDAVAQYLVLAIVGFAAVWLSVRGVSNGAKRVALVVLTAWTLFLALRLGFTRHDLGHPIQSFALVAIVVLVLGIVGNFRVAVATASLSAIAVFASMGWNSLATLDPSATLTRMQASASALLSGSSRTQHVDEANAGLRHYFGLESQVQAALAGKSVHVDPSDANAAWAYQLRWNPVPVLQSYSAYTPYLDGLNARALESSDGPETVLRAIGWAIDDRNPMWESPQYTVALVCNFKEAAQSDRWLVLSRTTDHCGAETELSSARLTPGVPVAVPAPSDPDSLVVARIDLDADPLNAIAAAVFKPISIVRATADDKVYRLPRAHAEGPLVLRMPEDSGWKPQFGGGYLVSQLSLNVSGEVHFFEIPIR